MQDTSNPTVEEILTMPILTLLLAIATETNIVVLGSGCTKGKYLVSDRSFFVYVLEKECFNGNVLKVFSKSGN